MEIQKRTTKSSTLSSLIIFLDLCFNSTTLKELVYTIMKLTSSALVTVFNLALASKTAVAERTGGLRAQDFGNLMNGRARKLSSDADFCSTCIAAADTPHLPTVVPKQSSGITVDGNYNEWIVDPTDSNTDYIGDMWNQGNKIDKDKVGEAFARYDPDTANLCILVLSVGDFVYDWSEPDADEQWIKFYSAGFNGDKPPNSDIDDAGSIDTGTDGRRNGWEGCFTVPADCYTSVQIHSNFNNGSTASTGKYNEGGTPRAFAMCLGKSCPNSIDECPQGCAEYECVDGLCVNPTQKENCCVDDEDCGASEDPCETVVCDPVEKTCKTTTQEDPLNECASIPVCSTPNSCFETSQYSSECATSSCGTDGACSFEFVNNGNACGQSVQDEPYEKQDSCDLGYQCDQGVCKLKYQENAIDCTTYMTANWDQKYSSNNLSKDCNTAQCLYAPDKTEGPTTCQLVPKTNNVTVCNLTADSRGDCDAGDRCVDGLCKTIDLSYKPGFVCGPSMGCCDIPEVCSGNDFACPSDAKYGRGLHDVRKVCRSKCSECEGDVEDTCPGGTNDCAEDIILEDKLCIFAGKNTEIGDVIVKATLSFDVDGNPDLVLVRAEMRMFDMDWVLDTSATEPIKSHWIVVSEDDTDIKIESSPGQYGTKAANWDTTTEFVFLNQELSYSTTDKLMFAIHLDVENTVEGNTETAWVMGCDAVNADDTRTKALLSHRFMSKNGRGFHGWGKWIEYVPCYPQDQSCDTSCPDEIGETPTDSPVATPTESPVATPTGSCSCSCNADGTQSIHSTCPPGPGRRAKGLFNF